MEDTIENRRNLRKSFSALRYGDFSSLETIKFVSGRASFYVGNGIELDIMTEMNGLENISFSECLKLSSVAYLEGIKVPYLHINHLSENKKQ